jgi:hypothetical protein
MVFDRTAWVAQIARLRLVETSPRASFKILKHFQDDASIAAGVSQSGSRSLSLR